MPFSVGDRVAHPEWGEGEIHRVTEDSVTVLFEEAGYRTLDAALAAERRLLERRESLA